MTPAGTGNRYSRISLAIVLGAVIVSAGIVVSSHVAPAPARTTTVTQTSTTAESLQGENGIDCPTAQPTGGPISDTTAAYPLMTQTDAYQCERVLVIPPGASSATLVVAYQSEPSATCHPIQPACEVQEFTSSVLQAYFSPILQIPESYSLVNATGVTVVSSPASINVTEAGQENFNVTYTISVSTGATGWFLLGYFDGCPTQIPLAVGYSASQVNDSAFPFYQPFLQGCIGSGMVPGGAIVSMSGFQTAWLAQTVEHQNATG